VIRVFSELMIILSEEFKLTLPDPPFKIETGLNNMSLDPFHSY
jgi:hypothetical protein